MTTSLCSHKTKKTVSHNKIEAHTQPANKRTYKFVETMADVLSNSDHEAKKLMAEWGCDLENNDASSVASEPEEYTDYDEFLEQFRRDVHPGDDELDHIILGTSDMEQSLAEFEEMTGMKPVMVVSMNGVGTKSARVAFQDATFLEIIGPDPKQTGSRLLGDKLSTIPSGKMVPLHYAIRSKKAQNTSWEDLGVEVDKVSMIARDKGLLWKWDMHILEGHNEGGIFPYVVDWGEAHHASGKLPIVGSLDKVVVRTTEESVQTLLEGIDGVNVGEGSNLLEFTFTSPKGTHTFSSSSPIGISFPK